jgi:hypothetical protein
MFASWKAGDGENNLSSIAQQKLHGIKKKKKVGDCGRRGKKTSKRERQNKSRCQIALDPFLFM